jgi:hypothetical protein
MKSKLVLAYAALVSIGVVLGVLLAAFVYFFWTGTATGRSRMMLLAFMIPAVCTSIYAFGIWLNVRAQRKDAEPVVAPRESKVPESN